MKTEDTGLS